MEKYPLIQSVRLADQVVESLKQEIIEGRLKPGAKLPTERELSERFGVSRTVIREATKSLEQSGLIVVQPGRGTSVVNQTHNALKDSVGLLMDSHVEKSKISALVEFREILEPGIVYLAAKNATLRDMLELQDAVDKMDAAINDKDAYIEADNQFHLALARATQNPLIAPILDPFLDLLSIQRSETFGIQDGARRGQIYHKQILEAIVHKDAAAAEKAMKDHLNQVRSDTEVALNEEKENKTE
jgi:GntR family transcriptional repressor for pyruvate dehydrogenase complex